MQIKTFDAGRSWNNVFHNCIFAKNGNQNTLIYASFAGLETSVKAMLSAIVEGRSVSVVDNNGRLIEDFISESSGYKMFQQKIGDLSHGIILHKSCIFEENHKNPVVIAPDGEVKKAVGEFLMNRYALPNEWKMRYYDFFKSFISDLPKIHNPKNGKWSIMKAVKITDLTEEIVLKTISDLLKNGTLTIPYSPLKGKFNSSWKKMSDYLKANLDILTKQVDKIKPIHIPKDGFPKWIAKMDRIPFPTQAHAITACVKGFDHYRTIFINADMGTGKSIMSLGALLGLAEGVSKSLSSKNNSNNFSVLLMAPGITIPKWIEKEINKTLRNVQIRVLRNSNDALAYRQEIKTGYKPNGIEIVLVGTDRVKLGTEHWCSAVFKRVIRTKEAYAWHCPECGQALIDPNEKDDEALAEWNCLANGDEPTLTELKNKKNLNGIPFSYPFQGWNLRSSIKKCSHCNSKLWRPALKSRGENRNKPRWSIARILKSLGQHFDLFICDEVHQVKAEDSGRGDAFAQLVCCSKRNLLLTGTLVNGKSTSIKEILWRTEPQELLDKGFDHKTGMVAWAKNYGVLMQVIKEKDEDSGIITRQKKVKLQPKEMPGISPKLASTFLLHRTINIELGDLGLPLVKLKEIPVFLKLENDHRHFYNVFHSQTYDACCRSRNYGGRNGAWSKFIPATINYADRPDLGACFSYKIKDKNNTQSITAPALPQNYFHPKERHLVETVKKELSENRGIVIYTNYTDTYGVHRRLQYVLKEHGIDSKILHSSVSTDNRVEWLRQAEENGDKVIITNLRLVEVGLDLLAWPTLYFYQVSYDINTVRQASRRAWRIGQSRECRVYYAVYDETQQMSQFQNIMRKRAHAMLTEGRLDKSELNKFGRDAHSAMASDIAFCLAETDLAKKWEELAAKDIDKNLKLVAENEFGEALSTRMRELQIETLKQCGLTDEEINIKLNPQPVIDIQATVEDIEDVDDMPQFINKPVEFGIKKYIRLLAEELPEYLRGLKHREGLNYNFETEIEFDYVLPDKVYQARGFVNVPNNTEGCTMVGKGYTPEEAFLQYIDNAVDKLKNWAKGEHNRQHSKINSLITEIKALNELVPIMDFTQFGFDGFDFTDFGFAGFETEQITGKKPLNNLIEFKDKVDDIKSNKDIKFKVEKKTIKSKGIVAGQLAMF